MATHSSGFDDTDDTDDIDDGSADALRFISGDESAADSRDELGALRFSAPGAAIAPDADVASLPTTMPVDHDDTPTDLAAIASQARGNEENQLDDEAAAGLCTVTNPPGSVSVSALIGGAIARVSLSAAVTRMTESELADEILAIAEMARLRGEAQMRAELLSDDGVVKAAKETGVDLNDVLSDAGIEWPSQEKAAAEQSAMFASRYGPRT
jgi:hypothetical protein